MPNASEHVESGLVLAWIMDGDLAALDEVSDLYAAFAEGSDSSSLKGGLAGLRAAAALLRGHADVALAEAERAIGFFAGADPNALWFPPWLTAALACAELGRTGAAETYLLPERRVNVASGSLAATWARAEAWSLAAAGDPGRAAAELLTLAGSMGHAPGDQVRLAHEALRLGASASDAHAAITDPEAVLDGFLLPALRASIRARQAADAAGLSELARSLGGRRLHLLAAEHAVWASQAYEAVGDSAAAGQRREALRHLEQCALAQTPALAGLPVLAPRETEVAQRVVAGDDNRSAARRLVLSPRTVEWHMRHLYLKTGATDRTDLAAVLPILLARA